MDPYIVTLTTSSKGTRVRVTHGADELVRGILPSAVDRERAVATFVDGLALWLDRTLLVVVSVAAAEAGSCDRLLDEMALGGRDQLCRVEVRERGGRPRRGARIPGVTSGADVRQLCLDLVGRSRT